MTDRRTGPDDEPGDNVGDRFARLPATEADRSVAGRATRTAVVDFWADRFGVPPETFAEFTFWEKGAGKVWVLHEGGRPGRTERDGPAGPEGREWLPSPIEIQALGMAFLRTRQEHWKPTTEAAQRFGRHATRNVVELTDEQARRFFAREDQDLGWDGDWGYLIAARETASEAEPLGVGLYLHGELRSMVPKGRRREL
ncbi:MAG: hypothetical protein V5A23_02660 [Halobacteriales archaeon]